MDAIDFFADVIDPDSDADAVFGDTEELMYLDLLCRIDGFDFDRIRSGAINKIRAKFSEHEGLLEAALTVAKNQNTRKTN